MLITTYLNNANAKIYFGNKNKVTQAIIKENIDSINVDDYIDRLGASLGIDTGGLIKTPEQKQAEQEQMMQQQSMNKLEDTISGMAQRGGPVAERMLDSMESQMQETNQQQGVEE